MPTEVLVKQDAATNQVSFADHANDGPGPLDNGSANISVEMAPGTTTALAAGNAYQSDKADLGTNWARRFIVKTSLEMEIDPTAGETVDFYWAPSDITTAGTREVGEVAGAKGAYSGYTNSTLQEGLDDLIYIGSLQLAVMNDTDDIQSGVIGIFTPPEQFGTLVMRLNTASAGIHDSGTNDDQFTVVFNGLVDEIQ